MPEVRLGIATNCTVFSVTSEALPSLTAMALTVTELSALLFGRMVSVVPSRVFAVFPSTLGVLPSVVYRTIQPSPAETLSSAGDVAAYSSCVRASAAFRAGAEGDCSLSYFERAFRIASLTALEEYVAPETASALSSPVLGSIPVGLTFSASMPALSKPLN